MGMLDRYRKKGGFIQLLNLLETTEKAKKEKFLKMIADESPAWHSELQKKMMSLDRVSKWSTQSLMEILPRLPYQQVGTAIFSLPPEAKNHFLGALGHSDKRKVEDMWKEATPNPAEISTCQMKLLTEIRKMASENQLKFDVVDPEMVVPDGIEEQLNSGGLVSAGGTVSAEALAKIQVSSEPPPAGAPPAMVEELTTLRKKVVILAQENQKMASQLQLLSTKLEQIRKIA